MEKNLVRKISIHIYTNGMGMADKTVRIVITTDKDEERC